VTGCVSITASNVTFKNSRVRSTCENGTVGVSWSGVSGVVIDHVEIDGQNRDNNPGLVGSGFTATALNIHNTEDGVDVQTSDVVEDSYIHDLHVGPGAHVDGIQSAGGSNVVVSHNTIDATNPGTNSAIIFGADLGSLSNTVANENVLTGGNFVVYAGTDGQYGSGLISITNNRFGTGSYGPCSFKPSPGQPIAFGGNVQDASGTALHC